MSIKFVMHDIVKSVENKVARRWLHGAGEDAVFEDDSQGWWIVFESCPASMHLGSIKPDLKTGDLVRLTVEKVQ